LAARKGEVLDVLVQSKPNKHAALKLMRKLLKKMPSLLSGKAFLIFGGRRKGRRGQNPECEAFP
jgi:hypothetical protein